MVGGFNIADTPGGVSLRHFCKVLCNASNNNLSSLRNALPCVAFCHSEEVMPMMNPAVDFSQTIHKIPSRNTPSGKTRGCQSIQIFIFQIRNNDIIEFLTPLRVESCHSIPIFVILYIDSMQTDMHLGGLCILSTTPYQGSFQFRLNIIFISK